MYIPVVRDTETVEFCCVRFYRVVYGPISLKKRRIVGPDEVVDQKVIVYAVSVHK